MKAARGWDGAGVVVDGSRLFDVCGINFCNQAGSEATMETSFKSNDAFRVI